MNNSIIELAEFQQWVSTMNNFLGQKKKKTVGCDVTSERDWNEVECRLGIV